MQVTACIPAAGSSLRWGKDKLFLPLRRFPTLYYPLAFFQNLPFIHSILLSLPENALEEKKRLIAQWGFTKIHRFLPGGPQRQDTVRIALEWVQTEWVLIHDASRPIVDKSDLEKMLSLLPGYDGVTLATLPRYTLATVSAGCLQEVISREQVWELHTPQIFRTSLLKQAHLQAFREGKTFTDDATLLAHYNGKIACVEASSFPFKLTYPGDEVIARCLLENIGWE
ncbi:MAG: IspD/TarI family cytidylyltransferase [bacterium JZ-2024 1]